MNRIPLLASLLLGLAPLIVGCGATNESANAETSEADQTSARRDPVKLVGTWRGSWMKVRSEDGLYETGTSVSMTFEPGRAPAQDGPRADRPGEVFGDVTVEIGTARATRHPYWHDGPNPRGYLESRTLQLESFPPGDGQRKMTTLLCSTVERVELVKEWRGTAGMDGLPNDLLRRTDWIYVECAEAGVETVLFRDATPARLGAPS